MGHLKENHLNELLYICTRQLVKPLASDKLAVLTPGNKQTWFNVCETFVSEQDEL